MSTCRRCRTAEVKGRDWYCRPCWEATRPVDVPLPIRECPACLVKFTHKWPRVLCLSCARDEQRERYRPIYKAAARVQAAIKAGQLKPARLHLCVDCGKQATEYDHRDYSQPLKVDPVCHSCNKLRGPAISASPAASATTSTSNAPIA